MTRRNISHVYPSMLTRCFFFKPNSLSEVFKIIKNISYLVYRCKKKNNPVYATPYPRGLNRSEQFLSNSKIYYSLEGG